jgi:WD40 repeat protein
VRRTTRAASVVLLFVLAGTVGLLAQRDRPPPPDTPLPDLKKVSTTDLGGHTQEVGSAGFSRDGKLVATGSYDRKVRVFDAATGKAIHTFDFGDEVNNAPDNFGIRGQGRQEGVVFDREGKRLAAVGGSWLNPPAALATVFDLTSNKAVFTSRAHHGMVRGAGFSADGSLLVTAGHDSTLKVLDAATGKERGTFMGHDWVVTAMTFSPDGKIVASACCNSQKRSIRLWDPLTLKESQNIPLPDRIFSIEELAFSPDGKQIAGVSNWRLHVWDVATGKPIGEAKLDAGLFRRLAYSPNGKRIAVAGEQGGGEGKGILRVYDTTSDKVHLVFVDADVGKALVAVSWPVDDKILLVGVRGKTAKLVTVELNK